MKYLICICLDFFVKIGIALWLSESKATSCFKTFNSSNIPLSQIASLPALVAAIYLASVVYKAITN